MLNYLLKTMVNFTGMLILTAALLEIVLSKDLATNGNKRPNDVCIPLDVKLCKDLGYSWIRLPNFFNHETTEEAGLELNQHYPWIQIQCSPYLREFLCFLYLPVCNILDMRLPPCRSLCEEARSGCLPVLRGFGFSWPESIDCLHFPDDHESTCLMGSLKNATVDSTETSIPEEETTEAQTSAMCSTDDDCLTKNTVCRRGTCICRYPYEETNEGCTMFRTLGRMCSSSIQCAAVTEGSECKDSTCACKNKLTNYKNLVCIRGVKIGKTCYNSAQCEVLNTFSFCQYIIPDVVGTCTCESDQFVDQTGRCSPRLGGRCLKGGCPSELGLVECKQDNERTYRCMCSLLSPEADGVCV